MHIPSPMREFVYEMNTSEELDTKGWITAERDAAGNIFGHVGVEHISVDETIRRIQAKRTQKKESDKWAQ